MSDIEVYNANSRGLPSLKRNVRLLLKLHSLPFFNKLKFLKKKIRKYLAMPNDTEFGPQFYCSSGNLKIGQRVSLTDTYILDYAPVYIGDNVSFSYKNMIITSTHDLNDFNNVITKPVRIGDNVWITTGVIILPGVTIGANTVIGAGSVVSKDVPAGVFAAGNPCQSIREIQFKK